MNTHLESPAVASMVHPPEPLSNSLAASANSTSVNELVPQATGNELLHPSPEPAHDDQIEDPAGPSQNTGGGDTSITCALVAQTNSTPPEDPHLLVGASASGEADTTSPCDSEAHGGDGMSSRLPAIRNELQYQYSEPTYKDQVFCIGDPADPSSNDPEVSHSDRDPHQLLSLSQEGGSGTRAIIEGSPPYQQYTPHANLVFDPPLVSAKLAEEQIELGTTSFSKKSAWGIALLVLCVIVGGGTGLIILFTRRTNNSAAPTSNPSFAPSPAPSSAPSAEPPQLWLLECGQGLLRGETPDEMFGGAVALSADGSIMAVGARSYDEKAEAAGLVRVFTRSEGDNGNSSWVQLGQTLYGESPIDVLGDSVDLSKSGNILAAGGNLHSGPNGEMSGYVRVFRYSESEGNWTQMGQELEGQGANYWFGGQVVLSDDGHILAVGGNGKDDKTGHVRVFRFNETADIWTQIGQDLNGEGAGDRFGESVAMSGSGTIVAAGGMYNDGNGGSSGHVLVFKFDDAQEMWLSHGEELEGDMRGELLGQSVALSSEGHKMAVGLWNRVRVYEFQRSGPRWVQVGNEMTGRVGGDWFGDAVTLSADGRIVAVGASDVNNEGGAGHVRVFHYDDGDDSWVQFGEDMDGERGGDEFGISVAMSEDGMVVAAGGHYHDDVLEDGTSVDAAGHVRVFAVEPCNTRTACRDCLGASCAWFGPSFGCTASCFDVADSTCYSGLYFEGSPTEICKIEETDNANGMLCGGKKDCPSCTQTKQTTLDGSEKFCEWNESGFCTRHNCLWYAGCGVDVCGEDTR